MKLHLHRDVLTEKHTLGLIEVDGRTFCYTVERAVKDNVVGTAIPAGEYHLELTPSGRVAEGTLWSPSPPVLPLVLGVPGRSGIRIHAGNDAGDTIGCILVGYDRTLHGVGRSRDALTALVRGMVNSLRFNDLKITEG